MTFKKRIIKKITEEEKRYETESLMKEKRSEEYEVLEEVFDKSTLMTIYDFFNRNIIADIYGVVSSGKEARIYWGKDPKGKELAIKIYLTISGEFKKGKLPYMLGDPRFANIKKDTRSLVFAWAQKEFKNLELAREANVRVPKPIEVQKNVLILEFIGENGVPAPSLKEIPPENPLEVYYQLIEYLERLYQKVELVHGDISEYNVMMWQGKPYIFDMAQAVLTAHPMADIFLRRDIENLNRYFRRLKVDVLSFEEIYKRVVGNV
jgi:RIO kinase 1